MLFMLSQRASRFGVRTMRFLAEIIEEWSIDLVTTNCAVNTHGALAARRAGLPHIWHIRERIGTDGSMHFRLNDERLVHRIAGLSTGVATVSEYVAGPFREYGADNSLQVVYDGVDVEAFAGAAARERGLSLRKKWGIPEDALLVGKVANVTAHVKRHDLFLRAVAEVARNDGRVRFVVVGALPPQSSWFSKPALDRWNRLESLAHDLGLDDRLVWAGAVPDPPAVMSAIDILAHACDIEGFPRVVFEAMAASRPVVGPVAGGVAEIVEDGSTGLLVPPGSVKRFAHGIERLIENAELRGTLGQNARKRVEERFTLRQHLDTMVNMYRSTVEGASFPATKAGFLTT